MTGFGDSEREAGGVRLRVEIRTVNHRYLKIQLRMPPGLERHQQLLERTLKEHFARGHVTVTLSVDRPDGSRSGPTLRVELKRARAILGELRALRDDLELEGDVDLALLSRFRGWFEEAAPEEATPDPPEALLSEAVREAALGAVAVRGEEGGLLREDLLARLESMEGELARVEARAPERLILERDRLREAVRELVEGQGAVDEDRIAREIAYLAERWDVHEELVRFRSHMEMFRAALEAGGRGGVGKRLAFVAQELLREANTIGSKGNDALIAESVVLLKDEIERLREQVENIE